MRHMTGEDWWGRGVGGDQPISSFMRHAVTHVMGVNLVPAPLAREFLKQHRCRSYFGWGKREIWL